MTISLDEQEVIINMARKDDTCSLYTSDATWITKMEKLVQKNPDQFKRIKESRWGNTYEFPKRFITVRSKDMSLSDDERKVRAERLSREGS